MGVCIFYLNTMRYLFSWIYEWNRKQSPLTFVEQLQLLPLMFSPDVLNLPLPFPTTPPNRKNRKEIKGAIL